jgi:hypothetical protein
MFIEFETIVQVKRFQYLSDAITEIILANGGRSGCAGATAPTRSTRRRRTAWLNSKRCISNLVFDTTLSSGREMGIRPLLSRGAKSGSKTVHGLAAGACRTYHRLSKQPSERGAIAQA